MRYTVINWIFLWFYICVLAGAKILSSCLEHSLLSLEKLLLAIQPAEHQRHEQHWYLTPRQHVFEMIFFTLIFGAIAICKASSILVILTFSHLGGS